MSKDGHTFYNLWSEFSLLSLKANTGLLSLKALPSVRLRKLRPKLRKLLLVKIFIDFWYILDKKEIYTNVRFEKAKDYSISM